MGRFLQYLIAFIFFVVANDAIAYQWYYKSSSGQYQASIPAAPTYSGGGGCVYSSARVKEPPRSGNVGNATQNDVVYDITGCGTATTQIGSAYTCNSGYYYQGTPASPTAACQTTVPSCPSGQVWSVSSNACVAAPTCASPAGTYGIFTGTGVSPYSFCGSDNCTWNSKVATSTSDGTWGAQFVSAGSVCTPSGTPPTRQTTASDTSCATSSTKSVCINKNTGCGTFNGEPFCVGATPANNCATSASGVTVCSNSVPGTTPPAAVATPPAPNNGTAGVAATPAATVTSDGSIVAAGGNSGASTTTLFSSTQTAASTTGNPRGSLTNPSGTGAAGAPAQVNGGAGSSSTVGTQSNPSVEDCTASHTCTNAAGGNGSAAPTDSQDFSTSSANFYSSLSASPIGSAMASVGSSFPSGGTVPISSFQAFGRTYTLTPSQSVIDVITPVLYWVMRAVWSLIAIRRFMEA